MPSSTHNSVLYAVPGPLACACAYSRTRTRRRCLIEPVQREAKLIHFSSASRLSAMPIRARLPRILRTLLQVMQGLASQPWIYAISRDGLNPQTVILPSCVSAETAKMMLRRHRKSRVRVSQGALLHLPHRLVSRRPSICTRLSRPSR